MKLIKWVLASTLIVALFTISYGFWFFKTPLDSARANQKFSYDLNRGAHPLEISTGLESLGVIRNHYVFYILGKLTKSFGAVKAAEYELNPGMSPEQIFKVLQSGIGIHRELLVREGENIYQVAESLEAGGLGPKDQLLKLMRNADLMSSFGLGHEGMKSLEGYLFPNTYYYEKKDQAVTVLKRMVDAFLKLWTPEYDARARELGLSRFQVVTLASMIEKETGAAMERPIISSVFHNRLKKRMRLQSDPTTIYGIWEHYDGVIHKTDLTTPTEYNTYTCPALPVGPISNPSAEAIRAALYPEQTDFLYFVSKNDGTHLFSKDYEQHRAGVSHFQIHQKTR